MGINEYEIELGREEAEEEKTQLFVENLLKATDFSAEKIASLAEVSLVYVGRIGKEISIKEVNPLLVKKKSNFLEDGKLYKALMDMGDEKIIAGLKEITCSANFFIQKGKKEGEERKERLFVKNLLNQTDLPIKKIVSLVGVAVP